MSRRIAPQPKTTIKIDLHGRAIEAQSGLCTTVLLTRKNDLESEVWRGPRRHPVATVALLLDRGDLACSS